MENTSPASAAPAPSEPQELGAFDKRLAAKLKEEGLSPKPRWHFLLKRYAIWLSGLAALLVGAAAIAVMAYLFQNNDWELLPQLPGFWEFFIITLPYFWFIFLGIFIFILNYNLRHTEHGYRYPVWSLSGGSILASLLLGGVLYAGGWGEKIDDALAANAPFYEQVVNRNVVYWHKPQDGRLTGVVVDSAADGQITLVDPRGRQWQVMATSGPARESWAKPGEPVKVLGEQTEDGRFRVKVIRPMHAGRIFMISRPLPAGVVHPAADGSGERTPARPASAVPGDAPAAVDIMIQPDIELLR